MDIVYSAAWLRALFGGVCAAGLILLLAAVVAGRGTTGARAGDPARDGELAGGN